MYLLLFVCPKFEFEIKIFLLRIVSVVKIMKFANFHIFVVFLSRSAQEHDVIEKNVNTDLDSRYFNSLKTILKLEYRVTMGGSPGDVNEEPVT